MANRIPLIVDTTDGNKIKELPVNDNLDLTNSNLVGVNSVQTQTLSIAGTPFTLQYSELQGAPTIPADISDLTDTQSLLGQGGGGGNVTIQGGGGLIVTADDSVARTILPGNTLKIQGAGDVTTALTEVNGTDILTITHTGSGGGAGIDTNTTYTLTGADGDDANSKKLRLRDSSDAIQDITLVAGSNVGITRDSNSLTFTSTDTDTTYGIASAQDGDGDQVLRLQSSSGATDDVKIKAGTNVSVTRTDENSITINNTQTLSNAFGTVRVGVTDVVADSSNDTLTLVPGTGIVITPNAGNDTIQIDSSITEPNVFQSIGSDSGSKTAGTTTDTLNVVGGSSISTSIVGSTLTINYTGNVGGEANNFEIVAIGTPGDNVELIADDPNDVLYIGSGSGITVSATGTGTGPGGAVDQVLITNSAPNVDQNIFYKVADDTDTLITASSITDTLSIVGGADISTSVVAGKLQIAYTGANNNFNVSDNFAYKTIAITPSGGSTTANSNVDTLNFQSGNGISMTATNDLITITNTAPNVDQNIFQNVLAGGQTITADTSTDTLSFAAGTGITITGDATGDQVTITNSAPNVNQNLFGSFASPDDDTTIQANSDSTTLNFVSGGGVSFGMNNTSKSVTVTNTSPNVDQNIFNTVRVSGQTDVTTASVNGVLTFVAGTNTTLTTDNTGKSVTINSSGSTQNLFSTIGADTGSTTANSATDTLTVTGGTGITTAITGDTLTVTNSSPNADQNLFSSVAVAGQSPITATGTTDSLTFVAGTNVTITTDTGTDSITINASGGGGGGTPGGADTQVQFNNSGAFGGDSAFTYNSGTDTLSVTNIEASSIAPPSSLVGTYSITSPTTITLDAASGAGEVKSDVPFRLLSKTVSQLNTFVASAGSMVYCTDETGGAIPAFYDGSNWRRVSDRSIVS
jgi:hypothetical protein